MKPLIGVLALACAVCGAPLAAQPPAKTAQGTAKSGSAAGAPQGTTPGADAMFIRTAAMDGMAEVEHGRLAGQNATNDEVKQFAQRMVGDHGKADDELKGLASGKNVTLPTELDAKHKAMQDKLSKMKGAAFDRAYMARMVMRTSSDGVGEDGGGGRSKGFSWPVPSIQSSSNVANW